MPNNIGPMEEFYSLVNVKIYKFHSLRGLYAETHLLYYLLEKAKPSLTGRTFSNT